MSDDRAITAAGGWCAPSYMTLDPKPEIDWDYVDMTRVTRIFETGVYEPLSEPEPWSFPDIRTPRGGVVYIGYDHWDPEAGPFSWDD